MTDDDLTTAGVLDALDAAILLAVDDDPQASVLAIAGTIGISRNTVHARLQRMHARRVLEGFSRRVAPASLGHPVMAFVSLEISQREGGGAAAALGRIPEVIEAHFTTGDGDLLVKVVARGTEDLHRVTDEILAVPGVRRSSTVVALAQAVPFRTRGLLERLAAGRS